MRAIAAYWSITRFGALTFKTDYHVDLSRNTEQLVNVRLENGVVHDLVLGTFIFLLENPGIHAISLRVFIAHAVSEFGN